MPEFRETFFGYFEGELNQNVWPKVAKPKGFETVNEFYANLGKIKRSTGCRQCPII